MSGDPTNCPFGIVFPAGHSPQNAGPVGAQLFVVQLLLHVAGHAPLANAVSHCSVPSLIPFPHVCVVVVHAATDVVIAPLLQHTCPVVIVVVAHMHALFVIVFLVQLGGGVIPWHASHV